MAAGWQASNAGAVLHEGVCNFLIWRDRWAAVPDAAYSLTCEKTTKITLPSGLSNKVFAGQKNQIRSPLPFRSECRRQHQQQNPLSLKPIGDQEPGGWHAQGRRGHSHQAPVEMKTVTKISLSREAFYDLPPSAKPDDRRECIACGALLVVMLVAE